MFTKYSLNISSGGDGGEETVVAGFGATECSLNVH
jgi:hypothetical protein